MKHYLIKLIFCTVEIADIIYYFLIFCFQLVNLFILFTGSSEKNTVDFHVTFEKGIGNEPLLTEVIVSPVLPAENTPNAEG